MERLSIGEFSAASGLSTASLRRYGEAGVLVPASVDPQTGYRWYDLGQVEDGVLVRLLREVGLPLRAVQAVLDRDDIAERLRLVESHERGLAQQSRQARATRDHVFRMLGGWQELVDAIPVQQGRVEPGGVLLRRRRASLCAYGEIVDDSVTRLRARADAEAWRVVGTPLSAYGWPEEGDADEQDRLIEVMLPVEPSSSAEAPDAEDADALLTGGPLLYAEIEEREARYPAVLAAYGAVAQRAREAGLTLLGFPLMLHLDSGRARAGWLLDTPADADESGDHGV